MRVNGDGSIRMQYDGSGASGSNTYTRGFALTKQVWNSNYDDAKYVGWMFGGASGTESNSKEEAQRNETNSEIKTAVDNWYKANIVDTGYSDYVHDAIFCNDRSTPGKDATGLSSDTGLGYGYNTTAYGVTARIGGPYQTAITQPKFTCPQENDKFTVEATSGGNGNSTYPVGLITADEAVAAGSGKHGTGNTSYYLKKSGWYWSFSPRHSPNASMIGVFATGSLTYFSVDDFSTSGSVAPVINLKPEYLNQLQGDGTLQNPYYLEI